MPKRLSKSYSILFETVLRHASNKSTCPRKFTSRKCFPMDTPRTGFAFARGHHSKPPPRSSTVNVTAFILFHSRENKRPLKTFICPGSTARIRVGSRWRIPRSPVGRDAGGGLSRVPIGPRPRVPVTGLASFFGGHQAGRDICARESSPESPQKSESVQDYPNPCKIGGHWNPATTNGSARASRAKSVREN